MLVSVSLTIYSYLFVLISGGSIEMHFHFFMIMAVLVVYSDWRLGWLVLVLTALHHVILNYVRPDWVYFYGRNDFSIVAHGIPVAVMAVFTTMLCQNQRPSVAILEHSQRAQSRTSSSVARPRRRSARARRSPGTSSTQPPTRSCRSTTRAGSASSTTRPSGSSASRLPRSPGNPSRA